MDAILMMENIEFESAKPHPFGRPPKLDNEKIEKFCDLIIQGRSFAKAAIMIGVSPSTLQRWLKRGRNEQDGSMYRKLVDMVDEATELSEFELRHRVSLAGQDSKNWRALAWMLERRFPEKYGKQSQHDKPLQEDAATTSQADLSAELKIVN
jgi:transposase-like protein